MREASNSPNTLIKSKEFGGKPTLVKIHNQELHALAAKYSSLIAESFFLQNVRGTYQDFESYVRKAHSALLAFLKTQSLDPEDPNLLLRALYNGRVPQNSPFKPTSTHQRDLLNPASSNTNLHKKENPLTATVTTSHASSMPQQQSQTNTGSSGGFTGSSNHKLSDVSHPKKYTEKLKAEASVVQRISELQKEGMWYDRRLPRNHEPARIKAHWDYLLEEMTWLATDFAAERKWKRNASKRCAKMIDKYFNDREIERLRAKKEDEIRLRRIASFIAKEIKNFWSNAQQIVEYKEQSRIEEIKKKALDQQLSYIVDQTEKYSSMLAESFVSENAYNNSSDPLNQSDANVDRKSETPSDDEFEPTQESEDDDEETIAKEEEENEEHENELSELERNGQLSLDDLLDDLPPGYLQELTSKLDNEDSMGTESGKNAVVSENQDVDTNKDGSSDNSRVKLDKDSVDSVKENAVSDESHVPPKLSGDGSADVAEAESGTDFDSEMDESESDSAEGVHSSESDESDILTEGEEEQEDEEQTVGLASLLQTFAPERAGEAHDDDALNSVAAMAESFQPKGYTLSSQTVNTKAPSLLHHTLREYQLIGLDWLVTMHEKKLNGILADEMGLGKTIQTIALLAHLAAEKGNWGPHLIVVPTSVMLNWEMEFKKWCPGFKILTYYGSIKERRLKRTGWTKPNAFHVCITSYKLVIQDHGSFRRKRWKYLILDEAQNIKNFKSQRWQLLLNFSTHRRLLLTGTPLQNNLMELWSLMHFLMPNVFQSHREFREWFSNPVSGMVEGNSEYNENIIRRLHKVLRPFILRRLKSEVEKQLPKKHEHVVMCRLSKRQRFLYEDFMSRTKTKETLATGNLLSVINVLMQLRKVCNHPNLFESRPVISPLQSDGITYLIPSIVWNIYDYIAKENSHALFQLSQYDQLFTALQSKRILSLKPPGDDSVSVSFRGTRASAFIASGVPSEGKELCLKRKLPYDEDITEYDYILQTTVVGTLPDGSIKCAPKRRKFLKWCADVALPAPRTKVPIPFFLMNVDPSRFMEDANFIETVGEAAPKSPYLKLISQQLTEKPPSRSDYGREESVLNSKSIESPPSNHISVTSQSYRSTRRGPLKSYKESDDSNDTESGMEEGDDCDDEQIPSEGDEDESFEDDESELSESFSDDDYEGQLGETSKKRKKKSLMIRQRDVKRRRRSSSTVVAETDRGSCFTKERSEDLETVDQSTELDDTGSEDYNLDKRNKVSCGFRRSTMGALWAEAMGYNPAEFQEADVQARSIRSRQALIDRLKMVNDERCNIFVVYGYDTIDQCRMLAQLPVMRYYGTRCRHLKIPYRGRSCKRNYGCNGYFLQGLEEVCSVSLVKNSTSSCMINHPLILWRHTHALMSMVWTLEEILEKLSPVLKRFIIYVPAVSSPPLNCRIFRPSPSRYTSQFNLEEELREVLRKPAAVFHPILSSMSTQFPDPRLIQYDCGKLQVLDTLLRRLKTESHRALIFTQMAKMLDVLEAFLNYHGHIYLRLDGATRIDQRQILMEKFNSDKRIFCFILSTRSGGIGINLTGADTVIFYDSDWNPTMDAQAQDRCHRIGQTRDVHIYRLVSEKTVEENILKKSNQKRLLGELAIEGGNFTTAYFQKHSIFELFDVQANENDALKRLTDKHLPSEENLPKSQPLLPESSRTEGDVDKTQMQIFESALAAAEDETDVQATRTVKAEAAAELAEFDESIPLEDLGDGDAVEKSMIDTEMESIMAELSKVEIYALKFMESTIDDWSRETVAQAQKELEQQKREWELEQIRQLEAARNKLGGDFSDDDELLTYSSADAQNQVWISQGGGEHFMPLWAPPTPPSDDSDVYVDHCHGFLYDYDIIPETNLPPVYTPPKKEKKPVIFPISVPVSKPSPLLPPPTTTQPSTVEEETTTQSTTVPTTLLTASLVEKKSPKVPRRDEPIFAPRSLFDRPSPAMAKLRRDYRLQKYNCRPMATASISKPGLGPGAITFPIVHPTAATKAPSPPPQHESVEWMIAEDHALLQTIQTILEMPLSLLVVNLAQTPNWDLAAEMVNLTSKIHRTPKQCKIRYETIVGPREEGKLFYEQPASAAAKNKKKSNKSFIKVGPPSPSRTGRIVKMSQLIHADNNSQLLNTYMAKFDLVKTLVAKRPTAKPMTLNPHMKTNKQAATIFAEHGINLENPVSAVTIANARHERLQMERKKLYAAQQAAVAAGGTLQSVQHPVSTAAFNAAVLAEGSRLVTGVTSIPSTQTTTMAVTIASTVATGASLTASLVAGNTPSATASEVVHKAKIAAAAAQSPDNVPVLRFTHPGNATTLQEMMQRRSPGSIPTAASSNPIMAKRQYAVSQQQSQLQAQLQIFQQQQMTQKQGKISLQLAQVAQQKGQTTLTGQSLGQQLQSSSPQQVVISQPSCLKTTAGSVQMQGQKQLVIPSSSQVMASTGPVMAVGTQQQLLAQQQQQVVTSISTPQIQLQQKQVVMAYHQQAVAAQKQQIAIQLSQASQVQNTSAAMHPSPVVINPTNPNQQIASNQISSAIQLQGQKQIVMTGPGQTQVVSHQQHQAQTQLSGPAIQLPGQKQVVMAYQAGAQGQIAGPHGQIVQTKSSLAQTQQPQQQQPTRIHVHLNSNSSGQGVAMGHQGQTVVLTPGLAQALNSVVSSASSPSGVSLGATALTNLMTTTCTSANPVVAVSSTGITPITVSASPVTLPRAQQVVAAHTGQQGQRTVTMQLVKQQTVGGKTVTRTVSESEVASFLKQHGLTTSGARVAIAGQPGTQAQISQISGTKGQQVTQVQVPAGQILTSADLQKLGYQITPGNAGGAQVATVLKSPISQGATGAATSLTFPLSFSQVRNVSQKGGTHALSKPTPPMTFQQQLLTQQRRQQAQQQQTASKLANIAQVSSAQGTVPQLIVQASPKQIHNTINVQHIQHVLKPGQVIQGQGGVLQAQLLTPKTMSRIGTSTASGVPAGTVSGLAPTMVTVSNHSAGHPTTVSIPASIVAASAGQPGVIRISQQNQALKPGAIQMITTQQASLINQQQQSLARPYVQNPNVSAVNVSNALAGATVPIRLQTVCTTAGTMPVLSQISATSETSANTTVTKDAANPTLIKTEEQQDAESAPATSIPM